MIALVVFLLYIAAFVAATIAGAVWVLLGLALIAPIVGWGAAELESRW